MTSVLWFAFLLGGFCLDVAKGEVSNPMTESKASVLDAWEKLAENIESNPSDQEFETLARGARGLRKSNFPDDRRLEVNFKLREAILKIPDFEKRLMKQLEEKRAAWEKSKNYDQGYDSERIRIIQTFQVLPDPRSVEALGTLLFDDSGVPFPIESNPDSSSPPENPIFAMIALATMLEDPPFQVNETTPVEVLRAQKEVWRLWFEEVESGKRSFRFKGDPRSYHLDPSRGEDWDSDTQDRNNVELRPPLLQRLNHSSFREGEDGYGDERLPGLKRRFFVILLVAASWVGLGLAYKARKKSMM
ncbi:hypothetical protein [Haloferula luteola]|uniref:hypothetical protein n=1 Tax=Haloferula luteola TaxID=595692 RepID=UPI0016121847|nr:hypothetical protein [Haloferula luteola]